MKEKETSSLFSGAFVGILLSICLFSSNLWAVQNVQITNTPEDERNPAIAMKDSSIYVAWDVPAKNSVYFASSTNSGRTWNPTVRIGSGDNPAVVVDDNGYIYIAWQNLEQIFMRKSSDGGESFEDSVRVANGYGPDVAIDSSGYIYVVWQKELGSGFKTPVFFSKSVDGGYSFSDSVVVDTTTAGWSQPSKVAVSPSGKNVYVLWRCPPFCYGPGCYLRVYFSKSTDGGATFSPMINPTCFSHHGEYNPDIEAYGENNVYIVWRLDRYHNNHIYLSISTNKGESFNCRIRPTEDKIDDGDYGIIDANFPSLAIDKYGDIHAVWADSRGGSYESKNIYFDKSIDGGESFGTDVRIDGSANQSDQTNPSIAVNNFDNLGIVWEDYRNGNYDLYFASVSTPFDTIQESTIWLKNQIVPNNVVPNPVSERENLILSYGIPPFDQTYRDLYRRSWIYDDALAVIAFVSNGDTANAKNILTAITGLINPDGSLGFSYNTNDPWYHEMKRTGAIAWVGEAICFYQHHTQDDQFQSKAESIADYIISLQDTIATSPSYGSVRGGPDVPWYSTEHNITAYFFLRDLWGLTRNPKYIQAANLIKESLLTHHWNPSLGRFDQGIGDPMDVIDACSLGALFLLSKGIEDLPKADSCLTYAEDHFYNCSSFKDTTVCGYSFFDEKTYVHAEASLQMALAYYRKFQYYREHQNPDSLRHKEKYHNILEKIGKMQKVSGGVYQSTKHIETHGDTYHDDWLSTAATAWLIIATEDPIFNNKHGLWEDPLPVAVNPSSHTDIPKTYRLEQNYPNPFNPATEITFDIPDMVGKPVRVGLYIYNLMGQLVRTVVDEVKAPGSYSVKWEEETIEEKRCPPESITIPW